MSGAWSRLWAQPAARAALVVLGVLWGVCLLGSALSGVDPSLVDLEHILLPPLSAGHLLGTDELGRDELMRLLWGGRVSLLLGVGVALGVVPRPAA